MSEVAVPAGGVAGFPLRIAVGIPTRGRAGILGETLRELRRQTRPPHRILVCHVDPGDVPDRAAAPGVEFLRESAGACAQRNAIVAALDDCDAVVFFDDDFLPAPRYLQATAAALASDPAIVVTTGRVVQDGATGPGLTFAQARDILAHDAYRGDWPGIVPAWNGYGCNMAIRLDVVRRHRLTFDERLALYAWYEDIDFTRRLGAHGRIVRVEAARGVHLGVKSGRVSGRRLGYSQMVNPIYLWRKGSYPASHALRSVSRHLAINCLRALWPEPYVDRRGRLLGNGLGLVDLLRRRARPERILEL